MKDQINLKSFCNYVQSNILSSLFVLAGIGFSISISQSISASEPTMLVYKITPNTELRIQVNSENGVQLPTNGITVELHDKRLTRPYLLNQIFQNSSDQPYRFDGQLILPTPDSQTGKKPDGIIFDKNSTSEKILREQGYFLLRFRNSFTTETTVLCLPEILKTLSDVYFQFEEPPFDNQFTFRNFSIAHVSTRGLKDPPSNQFLVSIADNNETTIKEWGTIATSIFGFYYTISDKWMDFSKANGDFKFVPSGTNKFDIKTGNMNWGSLYQSGHNLKSQFDWPGFSNSQIPASNQIKLPPTQVDPAKVQYLVYALNSIVFWGENDAKDARLNPFSQYINRPLALEIRQQTKNDKTIFDLDRGDYYSSLLFNFGNIFIDPLARIFNLNPSSIYSQSFSIISQEPGMPHFGLMKLILRSDRGNKSKISERHWIVRYNMDSPGGPSHIGFYEVKKEIVETDKYKVLPGDMLISPKGKLIKMKFEFESTCATLLSST